MNKIIFTIFATCLTWFCISAQAQQCEKRPRFDRGAFIAERNAYITAEVGLTPDEAAEFIPLCNELQQKIINVELEYRKSIRSTMLKKNPTEEDYKKIVDEGVEVRMKQASLEKKYYEQFKRILSYKKLYKYKLADDMFMKKFMRNKHRKLNSSYPADSINQRGLKRRF